MNKKHMMYITMKFNLDIRLNFVICDTNRAEGNLAEKNKSQERQILHDLTHM